MHPLNPFLRAFFRSTLPQQCSPVRDHVLLVPTTESFLNTRDRDSGSSYTDLASSEEFLASHVLRIPSPASAAGDGPKDLVRDSRSKPKQFSTINGRTVVVKDVFVYSNKGFKVLNQAQLLNDAIWYPDTLHAQPWLIYFITRPLVGSMEPVHIPIAITPKTPINEEPSTPSSAVISPSSSSPALSGRKDMKSFGDVLNNYPMIARQLQPGLQKIITQFISMFNTKPLPHPPNTTTNGAGATLDGAEAPRPKSVSLLGHLEANGVLSHPDDIEDKEDKLRIALEAAVTSAIDQFQLVDQQQLALLGSTTDLTGPKVERLLEKYVTEQLHDIILFPRLCALYKIPDQELQSNIKRMEHIDVSQVGIDIEGGRRGKQLLIDRLNRGVAEFRKLGVTGSPQEMMDILLATAQTITKPETTPKSAPDGAGPASEKHSMVTAVNADTLVSMLLIVVIRSQVRHLHARIAYMQRFIFVDDVEAGEMGYALSTMEALLQYLSQDSRSLRQVSRRNKKLWDAVQGGYVSDIKAILDPDGPDNIVEPSRGRRVSMKRFSDSPDESEDDHISRSPTPHNRQSRAASSVEFERLSQASSLDHVFPFEREESQDKDLTKKIGKRVSIHSRTTSASSIISQRSRATTVDSHASAIEGDTSVEKLTQTQGPNGESILMMAVQKRQPEVLRYLLGLEELFPFDVVLEDVDSDSSTLLSTAIQLGYTDIVEILLDFVFKAEDDDTIRTYFNKEDRMGRTVAHYLFNIPDLIPRLARMLHWKHKDKNGQTPLFALARSYDHPTYRDMVDNAISAAREYQADGQPLHLDEHVDMKGNTLLHVTRDPILTLRLLEDCDTDVNAVNDKRFTPLMVASKYSRIEMVRVLFGDPRVDLFAKELRGFTAVELAKDDDFRNRIDDLILFSNIAGPDGRTTAVVRSFFVDDATIRLVIKSGAPSSNSTLTVTTCRRSMSDFEHLAKWLTVEHPASWIPSVMGMRTPFQIPSKPARSVLRDIQLRLDNFLRNMLSHPTFSTHEMLWEFFLVQDINPEIWAERSRKIAAAREERVVEEFPPVQNVQDVTRFVDHARDSVSLINNALRLVTRRVSKLRAITNDVCVSHVLCSRSFQSLHFLPAGHGAALMQLSTALDPTESAPHNVFLSELHSVLSTSAAVLNALARPHNLITQMNRTSGDIEKHLSSLRRSDRWPLGLLDDTRAKIHQDAADRVAASEQQLTYLGSELTYTQSVVASELASWQDFHATHLRNSIRKLARKSLTAEKARLECMKRAVRKVIEIKDPPVLPDKKSFRQFLSPTAAPPALQAEQ